MSENQHQPAPPQPLQPDSAPILDYASPPAETSTAKSFRPYTPILAVLGTLACILWPLYAVLVAVGASLNRISGKPSNDDFLVFMVCPELMFLLTAFSGLIRRSSAWVLAVGVIQHLCAILFLQANLAGNLGECFPLSFPPLLVVMLNWYFMFACVFPDLKRRWNARIDVTTPAERAMDAARHCRQSQDRQKAEHLYRIVLDEEPDNADALYELAVMTREDGRDDVAMDLLRRLTARLPEYPNAQTQLGLLLRSAGQLDPAIQTFRQALRFHPDDALAHLQLADALKQTGRLDDALAQYNQAIQSIPDDPSLHLAHGIALREKGQLYDSRIACRKAIALNPNDPIARYHLALALNETDQANDAVAELQQVLALRPDFPDAQSALQLALKRKAELDKPLYP